MRWERVLLNRLVAGRQVIEVWRKDSEVVDRSERIKDGIGGPGTQISIGIRPRDWRGASVSQRSGRVGEMGSGRSGG